MLDAAFPSLLDQDRPGVVGRFLGRILSLGYRLMGKHSYDRFRLERMLGLSIVVLPTVANPKVLRTGHYFASQLAAAPMTANSAVLDLGTGSGVCALVAARRAGRVVAVDINPAAVRCATINAFINGLEERIELKQGDLFAPVHGERFDVVLFNPPFLQGAPKDARDAAWRCENGPARFAAGLADHLAPGGVALLLLSSFGDACALYESELRARGYVLTLFARRRFINETVTIIRAEAPTHV